MVCHNCSSICKKFGTFGPKKIQRYRCKQCQKTFSEAQDKPLDDMRIPMSKAVMALQLLLEGCAVASVERVTGLHKRTICNATSGEFQILADGWGCYPFAFSLTLGDRVSFAQQIKTYANNDETDTRYSPRKVTAIRNKSIFGSPDMDRVSTSYVERFNLELRMTARRFTRLTRSYSKKLANHKAMIALAIAYHNLCRYLATLRATPCMAQGITKSIWTIEDLLTATI